MSTDHGLGRAAVPSTVKRALGELRALRARLAALEQERVEPIAIVGMGCRFPGGATDPDRLWRLLIDGVDAVTEVPASRWDAASLYDPDPGAPGKMSTRWGAFLDGIDRFDPEFFGISRREANAMDPQQRLLLEVAWEALEHAGQAPDRLGGTPTGVFMGISSFDYAHMALGAPAESVDAYLAQGIAHSASSGRLAYLLGLQGPALSLDTACSSSLMAVHLAVQSLRRRECGLALAGGVNAILLPEILVGFSKAQMMAADGRCKTFDARADGFVRGEGCGMVVLKRLADALADRDGIWAVIRGSATNQDGRSSGLTAPNGLAQQAVIRAALADAGVEPGMVGYVETHGTGTSLGDPIEVQALGAVLRDGRPADRRALIGSLKTNLGHLEAAAGVASLMKAALALRYGEIPPSIHFRDPNPYIAWDELPLAVAAEHAAFPSIDGRRVAGVSSFGFTGSNVHVVLESRPEAAMAGSALREVALSAAGKAGPAEDEAATAAVAAAETRPAAEAVATAATLAEAAAVAGNVAGPLPDRPLHLLKLTARNAAALDELIRRWDGFLTASPAGFTDICFTATTGRADLPERMAVVAASAAGARDALGAHRRGESPPAVFRGRAASDATRTQVSFLFTGHGAQSVNMGRDLYETQPTFRRALEECDALLRRHLERPLLSVLYPEEMSLEAESLLLGGMSYSQPALFALEHALAQLWLSWGIRPAYVLGHSVGEYVAAVTAGVFDLEDGLALVAARGRLMDSLSERGAMLAIFAAEAEVAETIARYDGTVSVAAINGPTEAVISGESAAIEAIAADLGAREIEFRRLAVAQAGHSHLLDPILDEFEGVASKVRYSAPQIGLVSCTTGQPVSAAEVGDPRYWRRHLRQPVRFAEGIGTLHREGCEVFLEIGPHTNLVGMGSRCLPDDADLLWLPSLRRDWDDWQQVLESLAALYVRGVEVDWAGFESGHIDSARAPRRRTPIPTYTWQHRRYWLEHLAGAGLTETVHTAWERSLAAGRRQEVQGPLDLALQTFPTRWRALARLTTAIIANTLRELGAFGARGEERSVEEMVAELGIQPRYRRLLARWLGRLARAGLLREEEGGARFVSPEPLSADELGSAWAGAKEVLADWEFLAEYLDRCGELLPAVLTGRENPLETIFPDGSSRIADQLYRDSVIPRYYNALAGAVVSSFLESRPASARRALEVGGGTGGTTATLLPLLELAGGSYRFTDVSDLFLARAAERYGEYSCLSLGLFDVDRDPLEQGYAPGSFDLIVAANVLHSAADIPETLAHMHSLLAPGGLLLLVEVTTYLDWFDVSTALLEGWDRQGDALRPEHPMLSVTAWESALREAGFAEVAAFPAPGTPAEVMGQHVVVAATQVDAAASSLSPALDPGVQARDASAERSRAPAAEAAADAFAARLAEAAPHEREDLLLDYVRGHIAALLRLEPGQIIDRRRRLLELGLDSLMAVELRSRLGRGLTLAEPLPATLVFDYPSVDAIVRLLLHRLGPDTAAEDDETGAGSKAARRRAARPVDGAGRRPAGTAATGADAGTELEALSEEEAEARLLARLETLEEADR